MITADTSTFIDLFRGRETAETHQLADGLRRKTFRLAPPVAAELLSFPGDQGDLLPMLARLKPLPITEGFWERVGTNRRRLLALGLKAKLADALIAQCCLDSDAELIASDRDFRHFAAHCGLKLAV